VSCVPNRRADLALAVAVGVVVAYYGWTASSTANPFAFGYHHDDFYNLLTDALLAGQLHLHLAPRPELLGLPDPYDPRANAPYRIQDLSLYKGRHYLYFGIVPALALFVPWRVSGTRLPENFAAVLFMAGGLVWMALTLRAAARRLQRPSPAALLAALVLFIGLSAFETFVLRRPSIYEVAVAAGFCFLAAACYCLLRSTDPGRLGARALLFASLFLGLAVGSRPNQVVAAPLLLLAWRHRRQRGDAIRAFAPFAICVALLLLYNRARFDDWFEFGQHRVLAAHHAPTARLFSLSYLPSHALANALWPATLALEFPFFHLKPPTWAKAGQLEIEGMAGLLVAAPPVVLAALWLVPAFAAQAPRIARFGRWMLALGVASLLFVSAFAGVNGRYLVDFGPPLLLSAALAWIALHAACAGRRRLQVALHAVVGALWAYGLLLNVAVGLTGYYDWFRQRNPVGYAAFEDRFVPLQRLLLSLGRRYGDLRLQVRFPVAAGEEALVSVAGTDVLCVRYEEDRLVLRFRHGDGAPLESRPIAAAPARVRILEVSMGSLLPPINARALGRILPNTDLNRALRRLRVQVDGEEVLTGVFDFEPAPARAVAVGRSAAGPVCPRGFTGEVLSVDRRLP
jgi:hypothetical protein